MNEQNARRGCTRQGIRRCIIILVCACAGAAVLHAFFFDHWERSIPPSGEGSDAKVTWFGWPFLCRDIHSKPINSHTTGAAGAALADMLICAVLLALTTLALISLLSPSRAVWQLTLLDAFVYLTAVAVVLFLFTWDMRLGIIGSTVPSYGDYSNVGSLPKFDQAAIWFCVFCAVSWGLKMAHRLATRGPSHWPSTPREGAIGDEITEPPAGGGAEPTRAPEPRSGLGKWKASSAQPGDDGRSATWLRQQHGEDRGDKKGHSMGRIWTGIATFLGGLCGCGPTGDAGRSSVAVAVPTDDAVIDAATQHARSTIAEFKQALAHPKPAQSDFSVKVELPEDRGVHYLWLQQVTCSGSNFSGTLGSDASGMKDHKPGEAVTIAADQVCDWMYVENNKLVGGFTLRAIRDKLRGAQREAFEKSLWFAFE
jgi:uncharacterized protein YegJ (DUF2314 family)